MSSLTGKNALIAGDDQTLKVTAPFPLTGYTVYFTMKPQATLNANTDVGATIQQSVTPPTSTDTTNGICYIPLSSVQTRVAPAKYYFDLQFVSSAGKKVSCRKQEIEVTSDVTKA